ncbi:hypothetical protein BDQ17DRAFT_1429672 [Cyathus striatus]|nr:hypothetical protein BDQ17DRAFT_1429672 [Cyathus striatus]
MPPSQTLGSTPLVDPNWSLLHDHVDMAKLPRAALEERYSSLLQNLQFAQDRDKACQSINEAANAQLIVQNMALNRTVLLPGGLGRHLTDPELIQAKRACEEDKRQEEREKKRRKADKKRRKEEKDRRDEEWKQIIAAHKNTVEEWEQECARLRAARELHKNLPKKPTHPLKRDYTNIPGDGMDEEGESTEDEVDVDN